MNFKILFKAIGLVSLGLLALAIVTYFGTLAFLAWPDITTIVILVTMTLCVLFVLLQIVYYRLEERAT